MLQAAHYLRIIKQQQLLDQTMPFISNSEGVYTCIKYPDAVNKWKQFVNNNNAINIDRELSQKNA